MSVRKSLVAALASVAMVVVPASAQAFALGLDSGFGPTAPAAQLQTEYKAMNVIDGSVVRIGVSWAAMTPDPRPAGFHPANPGDVHYNWAPLDSAIRDAAQHHFKILLDFAGIPRWAQGPASKKPPLVPIWAWDPNVSALAQFIHAVAARYGGSYPDPLRRGANLPRVSYWEPWDEPNIPGYFAAPHPVSAYRTLLNKAYGVLKAVHRDNVVVLGGLAPVSPNPGSIAPLDFGAELLCLHRVGAVFRPDRSCPQRTDFDVFGVHPYSLAATPTKHAYKPGDDLVGDMAKVGLLVRTADRFHTTAQRIHHQLWVTEFSWMTNPPDPELGDADATAARYVAYSLYEMWRAGASLVVWQQVLDSPTAAFLGGGLYFESGQPKETLSAFAFPFIASVSRGKGFVWGRVPVSHRARVVVQRAVGSRWVSVASAESDRQGLFTARFPASQNGLYRAQVPGGPTSLAYDSVPIPPSRTHAL